MEMNLYQSIGFVITLFVLVGLSVYSGKKAKGKSFSGGKSASTTIVAGTIIGTLVGGSSTIGTAQLAYNYGMSAWWFTLGAGLGCLIMAIWFVKPFRAQNKLTITGMVNDVYGPKVGLTATLLSSLGIFVNIIAQLIAATTIIAIFVPDASILVMALIAAALMVTSVIFGGVTSAGMVGILKTALLYLACIGGGLVALSLFGGVDQIVNNPVLDHDTYFNIFARGVGKDLGAGLSLLVGVLSTQTYVQAVLAGKNDAVAVKGALISAALIPPIGIGGILIGLYMRVNYPDLANAKFAFPTFVLDNMPPLLGGVIIATLLIAVVGTGSGLALGISTIINQDIVQRVTKKFSSPEKSMLVTRFCIVAILFIASFFTTGALGDIILDFSFMSMGLRGAVLFVPLLCLLFFRRRVKGVYALASVIAGPVAVFVGNFFIKSFDPLFIGIAINMIIMGIGLLNADKPEA